MSNIEGFDVPNADFTLTVNRSDITLMLLQQTTLQELLKSGKAKVEGDLSKMSALTAYLDDFEFWFKMHCHKTTVDTVLVSRNWCFTNQPIRFPIVKL